MSKKIPLLFLIIFLTGLLFPLVSLAGNYKVTGTTVDTVYYQGLVPCGLGKPLCNAPFNESGECTGDLIKTTIDSKQYDGIPCQFCHFFVMLDSIVDFVLFQLVPPIGVLMLVIGGFMFLFAGENPSNVEQGRKIMSSVMIGIVLIYGSWLIINLFFSAFNLSDFALGFTGPSEWAKINCEITLSP